jgi:hypothetical protein
MREEGVFVESPVRASSWSQRERDAPFVYVIGIGKSQEPIDQFTGDIVTPASSIINSYLEREIALKFCTTVILVATCGISQ